jgi:hypothetical protein
MDLLNVPAATTSSGSTKVLIQEGNTLKSRTASDLISGSSSKLYSVTLVPSIGPNEVNPSIVSVGSDQNDWGWPSDFATLTEVNSKKQAARFTIPFNPTNYRITSVVATNADSGTADGGDFGLKFEKATSNTNSDGDWSDLVTVGFRGKVLGDYIDTSGSVSFTGSPSSVYIRVLMSYTLTDGGTPSTATGQVGVRNLVITFWN